MTTKLQEIIIIIIMNASVSVSYTAQTKPRAHWLYLKRKEVGGLLLAQ